MPLYISELKRATQTQEVIGKEIMIDIFMKNSYKETALRIKTGLETCESTFKLAKMITIAAEFYAYI